MSWLTAFLLTQLIEISAGIFLWKELPRRKIVLYVFLASCMTHPIVWFVFPKFAEEYGWSYPLLLLFAEAYAYLIEYSWYRYLGAKNPFSLSCVLNSCSFLTGLLIYYSLGYF